MGDGYSIGYSARKVGDNMSFVGMHITNEGIIAFADSKATLKYKNRANIEDTKRGRIKKIFKNSNFILVTYGNNEIYLNKKIINIEDYIDENLKNDTKVLEFIDKFQNNLSTDVLVHNDGLYQFIIGTKDDNGNYCIYHFKTDIKKQEETQSYSISKPIYKGYSVGGNQNYIDIYNIHTFYHNEDISEYSQHIRNVVKNMVQLEDCFHKYEYNPVGLPINVEIFQ